MKIALCFSGQPRFIEEASSLIKKNVIDGRDVDVFAHLWFDENLRTRPYKYGGNGGWESQRISSESINVFEKTYKPLTLKVEESRIFLDHHLASNYLQSRLRYKKGSIDNPLEPDFTERDINNIISYYYSLNQVNLLKKEHEYKNNFKYDIVIKLRTDVIVGSYLNLNSIYPNSVYYSEMGQPDGMISDWLNFGDSLSMDAFMSSFSTIDFFIKDSIEKTGGSWCCEMIHRMCADKFGILPRPVPLNLSLPRF